MLDSYNRSLRQADRRLALAIVLTALILMGEVAGGLLANSLALLADAGHLLTDLLALSLSLFAVRQMQRPPTRRMTFGYHRVGILTATVNAVTLIAIAAAIFWAASQRLRDLPEVEGGLTLLVAGVGLAVNLAVAAMLLPYQKHSLNVRSAFLHVLGDLLGSVAVIVSAVVILLTAWFWVDPIVSVFIGLVIAVGAWRIIRESIGVLLEATPAHLDVHDIATAMSAVPGVRGVHDLHVWSITPGLPALSCHVTLGDAPISEGDRILARVNEVLATRFGIAHSTIQMETPDTDPNAVHCSLHLDGPLANSEAPHQGPDATH